MLLAFWVQLAYLGCTQSAELPKSLFCVRIQGWMYRFFCNTEFKTRYFLQAIVLIVPITKHLFAILHAHIFLF